MAAIEVVYLHKRDTLETARELIQTASPGAQLWLVAPRRWGPAHDLVSLKRLQHTAEDAAVDLRLASLGYGARLLAREARVVAYSSVPWKLRRYRRERTDESAISLPARLRPVEGRLGFPWRRRHRPLTIGVAFLALLVIAAMAAMMAGLAVALVPMATITLVPVSQELATQVEVSADPTYREVEPSQNIIPARQVEVVVEGRGDTPTTGRADMPDAFATGQVVFSNKTSRSVKVPKGTIVRTASGQSVRFLTLTPVELPASMYSTARMGITAAEPGPEGNVSALAISIVEGGLAASLDVLNDLPTQGGLMRAVATVTVSDTQSLRQAMESRLQQEAYARLAAGLQAGEFVPPDSLRVAVDEASTRFDQSVGQQAPKLSMVMKVVVKGVVVDERAIDELAGQILQAQAGDGMSVVEGTVVARRSQGLRVEKNNVVRFAVSLRGSVAPRMDVEKIKSAVRGRSVSEAAAWLSTNLKLRDEPQVAVQPQPWEYLPWLPGRIHVVITVAES